MNELALKSQNLHAICRQCQGSMTRDVICVNTYVYFIVGMFVSLKVISQLVSFSNSRACRDCPIYYRRQKAASDIARSDEEFVRFCQMEEW
ncbi:hypothetical protein BC936DRAFT_144421 [Jimgerdemannia flammicorona]|uniref:Uncharacterized protein n=1 Tax=Jimgerdemannia flammicorona TaxID=994334 RepID=A0A433DCJ8_9FUNG|nr:hypothetical protein BC936DRAFT_144421 [Jimgerdemannia flammicorona]